jgi:hypothetical protein
VRIALTVTMASAALFGLAGAAQASTPDPFTDQGPAWIVDPTHVDQRIGFSCSSGDSIIFSALLRQVSIVNGRMLVADLDTDYDPGTGSFRAVPAVPCTGKPQSVTLHFNAYTAFSASIAPAPGPAQLTGSAKLTSGSSQGFSKTVRIQA